MQNDNFKTNVFLSLQDLELENIYMILRIICKYFQENNVQSSRGILIVSKFSKPILKSIYIIRYLKKERYIISIM